jgi:UDP-N-acetylmuramoyl-L-alanyl-D-glutamate--2,6-diaminopimelate ligase
MRVDAFRELEAQGAMIERLASDSRRCAPGVAFFAWRGAAADGRGHIADAIARGAAAVLWEQESFAWNPGWAIPNVAIKDLKGKAGGLAHEFYGRPSERLWVCGVTGTNGKTSCSQWIAARLGEAGIIGTLGAGFPGDLSPLANTTPDALEIHGLLKEFVDRGAKRAVMEVSSHALAQGRVNGVAFDCALFTNLSHDHLDYHGTMQAYGEAKGRLFESAGLKTAVINLDDSFGVQLAQRVQGARVIGYGFADAPATRVDEYLPATLLPETGQLGRFNRANALGVMGCLFAAGLSKDKAISLLSNLPPVPGRMQKIGDAPLVVVDYAHTPDALEKVLTALQPVARERAGKLVAVIGAGGDRDAAKRPVMGQVAARLADRVLVTSDNPRSEDPRKIIAEVQGKLPLDAEVDRGTAIRKAVSQAEKADVILVAGKGHEDYQEIGGKRLPFSDAAVARAALQSRGAR